MGLVGDAARIGKRLCVLVPIMSLPALAVIIATIVWHQMPDVDRSPPLPHQICPKCQRLLREHNVKLDNPELAGCHGGIHAATYLEDKGGK
jgi:hypothetical protein